MAGPGIGAGHAPYWNFAELHAPIGRAAATRKPRIQLVFFGEVKPLLADPQSEAPESHVPP